MALILEMEEGRSFYLQDVRVEVDRIFTPTRASLTVHGAILSKKTIGPKHRTELLPNIYAQIGMTETQQNNVTDETPIGSVKVALEAPRNIKILRDNLYAEIEPDVGI